MDYTEKENTPGLLIFIDLKKLLALQNGISCLTAWIYSTLAQILSVG